jgi:hypothetical protein
MQGNCLDEMFYAFGPELVPLAWYEADARSASVAVATKSPDKRCTLPQQRQPMKNPRRPGKSGDIFEPSIIGHASKPPGQAHEWIVIFSFAKAERAASITARATPQGDEERRTFSST